MKILHDIDASFTLLMRTLRQRYPIPFRNARVMNDGSLRFSHKIDCHGNVSWDIGKRGPDRSSAPKTLSYGENIAKISP